MKRIMILFLLLWNVSFSTHAQQKLSLRGKVIDSTGDPITGATLSVEGQDGQTSSRADGTFSLEYQKGDVLLVSSIGYLPFRVVLAGQTTLDVQLQSSSEALDEVVVVGYGTQRRGEVTSSIASVKSEDFTKGAVKDAGQLVQGKVAGLRISTPSGDPGESSQINLRGLNSINGSQNPLVIVDGVPGDLNTVAPEDIESIDVLKDGSAAAIYGTRATAGVILVTTRRNTATENRTTIEYNGYASLQTLFRKPEMMDASDYRRLIAEGVPYDDLGGETNWIDEVTRNPSSHNHNLTLFGGNSRTNFTGSINYRDWQGVLLKSGQERLNIRTNLNHDMFDGKLKTNVQLISRSAKSNNGGSTPYMWRQAIIRNPTDRIYNDEGKWQERDAYFYDNPLGMIHESINDSQFRETRLNGSVDYRPLEGLSLKMLLSRVQNNNLFGGATTFDHVNTTKNNLNGTASRDTRSAVENLMELTANYTKTFEGHKIDVLGGYSWQDDTYEQFYAYNFDFPTDNYTYNKLEAGMALQRGLAEMTSYKENRKLAGFFARVAYNYQEKYMVMASIRREGSSTFGENNKWGSFPAISVGWDIAKEDFMANVTPINQLKLRAGFGVTGTIVSAAYMSQTSYNFDRGQGGYVNGRWVPGFVPTRNFNPDLRWERKHEYNVGLDFSILDNRVYGSLDYYTRRVKDLLYQFNVPSPPYLYPSMMLNSGEMSNSGFEALINVDAFRQGEFKWKTGLTVSTNKNKLINLSNDQFNVTVPFFEAGYTGEPIQIATHRVELGRAVGDFFVLKTVGVDENGKWLVENKEGETIPISESSPDDRQYYGNGIPDVNLGWNNSFSYKNVDFSFNLRGSFGHQILNMTRLYYENPINKAYNVLKTAYDPVYGQTLTNDLVYVSHYIEDADFLKLDNVTLGYTFKPNAIKGIQNLRVYASGFNLMTITGYKGLDPEAASYEGDFTFAPGIEHRDRYPTTRTFTVGLNVTF
ncbi:SusC/RagA family TonB-linked outer membrane protein [Sphingobacterium sp. DN00404]|uniref:SusC/RagA family TonB-linked outer membrane protein n=1 Tax=Sphingobacterium micropteri TaxID=2763501 RepID=A0ABR7YIU8_9SPHI|nr:SusC/RagA family TonB-linked outer membrane protein [Sphingobacterium micropteri]MBD1431249.1 SusC/RagA family TonB-linked outer membrane protein [Sphingobacterium micropteri]